MEEHVVLVNRKNEPQGTAPKFATHHKDTPLHRGFSVFLFNKKGELLLQKRSAKKKTWPLVWSNSVCGHPAFGESNIEAAKRRLEYEIGIKNVKIYEVVSDFSYKATYNDVSENEICPILVAFSNGGPKINKDEVEDICWISWREFLEDLEKRPDYYSVWSVAEAKILNKNQKFNELLKKHTNYA